ncbi:hypothetical protein CRYUN_Cryun08bG0101600 [Craigia yunnanensis]
MGSYATNEDGEVVCKKGEGTYFDPLDLVFHFELGMIFEDPRQFKDLFTKYSITKRFDYNVLRNEKRTRVACKYKGCPFVIFAGVDNKDGLFKIKTLKS